MLSASISPQCLGTLLLLGVLVQRPEALQLQTGFTEKEYLGAEASLTFRTVIPLVLLASIYPTVPRHPLPLGGPCAVAIGIIFTAWIH